MENEFFFFVGGLIALAGYLVGYCRGYDACRGPRDDLIADLRLEIATLKKPATKALVCNHQNKPWDCEPR